MRDHQAARLTGPVDFTPRNRLEVEVPTSKTRKSTDVATHREAVARGSMPRETSAINQPPGMAADFLPQPEIGVFWSRREVP